MNIVDIIIILMIIMSGIIGMKRGFFKGLVMSLGWLILFIIAFKLKDPLAEVLSLNLPFFNFWGAFKGVTVLNIILYQLIAFLIIYSILMIIYTIAVKLTGILETFLNATIILGIPSKILGFILGLLEGFILTFIVMFIISLPIFNIKVVNNSAFTKNVLRNTPIMSSVVKNTNQTVNDIVNLKKEFENNSDKEEFNRQSLKVMLKYDLITVEYAEKLAEKGKIKMEGIDEIINEYR